MAHTQTPNEGQPGNLEDVLEKTKQVAEEIKDAADELKVVHAVLETGGQSTATSPDFEKAVDRTQQLEEQLHESADKLDAANEVLEELQKSQP